MAEHAHIRMCLIEPGRSRRRYLAVFKHHVTKCDLEAAPTQDPPSWKSAGFKVIHVAGHGGHRGEPPEALDDMCAADVAGMEDLLYTGKMPLDGRIVQSMRIGDDADALCRSLDQRAGRAAADCCTLSHWNVKGSGRMPGNDAASRFRRSARPALIGCVDSHSTRPCSCSASR